MNNKYKNSYIVKEKELVSLSVYNVGFQSCDSLYQWGPGIRDHYLIHYIISGKGRYTVNGSVHTLTPGDAFLVYPNTEVIYQADAEDPWEYTWVGFTGSDAGALPDARPGTAAVDPAFIPPGSRLYIVCEDGTSYGIAQARAGSLQGRRIDLYFSTQEEREDFGRKNCTVYFLG